MNNNTITEKERKSREELFKLLRENPDLPLLPMVDSEIVADDGYSRWTGSWGDCYVGEYLCCKERVYFRDDDDPCEIETVLEEKIGYDATMAMNNGEMEEAYAALPWIKAIIVDIDMPQ